MPRSSEQYLGNGVTIMGRTLCRRLAVHIPEGYLAFPTYFSASASSTGRVSLKVNAPMPSGDNHRDSVPWVSDHLQVYVDLVYNTYARAGLYAIPRNMPNLSAKSRPRIWRGVEVPRLTTVKASRGEAHVYFSCPYEGSVFYGATDNLAWLPRMLAGARYEAEARYQQYRADHAIRPEHATRVFDSLRQLEGCVSLLDRDYAF